MDIHRDTGGVIGSGAGMEAWVHPHQGGFDEVICTNMSHRSSSQAGATSWFGPSIASFLHGIISRFPMGIGGDDVIYGTFTGRPASAMMALLLLTRPCRDGTM